MRETRRRNGRLDYFAVREERERLSALKQKPFDVATHEFEVSFWPCSKLLSEVAFAIY
jgi:hypothetical protein